VSTQTIVRREIPWELHNGEHALGRHIEHDERSKLYRLDTEGLSAADVEWAYRIGQLNQQATGKCTAEAACEILGSDPFFKTLTPTEQTALNDAWTDVFYSDEELLDGDGPFPPNDNGSSGLTSAKVAKNRKLISGYLHTFTAQDAINGLQKYPASWGTNWKSGMDSVNVDTGQVTYTGTVRGGHELELFKIVAKLEQVWFRQSWGPWGYHNLGMGWISFEDFEASLADQGDVTFYVPRTSPAPTPVITDPVDAALVAAGDAWEPSIFSKITKAGKFKVAFDEWKSAKGYK
jgi:hypothetical protein